MQVTELMRVRRERSSKGSTSDLNTEDNNTTTTIAIVYLVGTVGNGAVMRVWRKKIHTMIGYRVKVLLVSLYTHTHTLILSDRPLITCESSVVFSHCGYSPVHFPPPAPWGGDIRTARSPSVIKLQ